MGARREFHWTGVLPATLTVFGLIAALTVLRAHVTLAASSSGMLSAAVPQVSRHMQNAANWELTERQQQQQQQLQQQQLQQQQLQQLGKLNFLIGIAAVGAASNMHSNSSGSLRSTLCGKELEMLLHAVATKQIWTLKVLDSFGQPPRSFSWGNYFWFAARNLCDELNEPFYISFSQPSASPTLNITSPMPLAYTMVYLKFLTPHYIDIKLPFEYVIHLGLCLPRSCDSAQIVRYTQHYFESGTFEFQRDFQVRLQALEVRKPHFSWNFFRRTSCIIFSIALVVVIFCAISAELLHKSNLKLQQQQQLHMKAKPTNATEISTLQQQQQQQQKEQPTNQYKQQKSFSTTFERILLCFQATDNYRRALNFQRSHSHSMTAISGLRSIICLWVTVFHVYYYSLYAMTNAPLVFAKLEQFALQPFIQACFYVDVFFVISAFLLVHNFLSNETQMRRIQQNCFVQNLKLYGQAVLHRYLRLTPIMLITMLLSDMVFEFLNMYTPFRLDAHSAIYCKRNWWYNLFYIHNLLDMRDICCSWTWYLSCEMQYFMLCTALLFVLAKIRRPQAAKIAFATLALGFAVTGWICNYWNGVTFQIDVIHSTLNQLYVKPWVRINPYIGGAALGWLLHHCQQQQQQQYKQQPPTQLLLQQQQQQRQLQQQCASHSAAVWRAAFWLFFGLLYITTNFMSYWRSAPTWLVATIMSFGKLLFALCMGAVILLCARGQGGWLNELLSARIFVLLDRLSFSVYMVAPVIVIAVFGIREEATTFSEVDSGMDFLGIVVLSIAVAFLLLVLVELPVQRISNTFLRQASSKNMQSKQQSAATFTRQVTGVQEA